MTTTLQNGIKIPDKYSRDWYADLSINWNLLDNLIGQIASGTFQHDVIPSTTGTYKLGSSTNVWDAVYGNAYFLGTTPFGDIVTHNASEFAATEDLDNCVHITGAETITGDKTFTGAVVTHNITPETDGTYTLGTSTYRWLSVYSTSNYFINRPILTFGTPPSNSDYFGYRYNDNTGAVFGDLLFCAHKDGQNYLRVRCRNTDGTNTYDREMRLHVNRNGVTWLIPNTSNTIELGTSSNKWKSLNGINPGALSLPASGSSRVDISSSITDLTGADISYTPTVNGWLMLRIDGAVGNFLYIQQSAYGIINRVDGAGTEYIYLNFPFQANVALTIRVKGSSGLIARYYPCLGNV